jgi:hypothetical protein
MLPPVRRPDPRLGALIAAVALAGCGSGGPSDQELVARTVTDFGRATAAKDYPRLCEQILSPSLIEDLTQIGLPCEQALRRGLGDVKDPRLTIGRIEVDGDRATAEVRTSAAGQEPSRDTLRLERVGGSWRIASLGS